MNNYELILIGLDLTEESDRVISKAVSLTTTETAKLYLVHVIEPLSFAYGGDIPIDLSQVQQQLENQAKNKLKEYGNKFNIPEERQIILIGQPSSELHNLADQKKADLIVVGSHGRQGLALILGSTTDAVVHGAKCDILAVKI